MLSAVLSTGALAFSTNFSEPGSSPYPVPGPWAIAAADLDGDTDTDLAVASGEITILLNNGSGKFNEPSTSPESGAKNATTIAAADFDGDDDQDLASNVSNRNEIRILLNNGAADFSRAPSSPEVVGPQAHAVIAANLDGLGGPDLAVVHDCCGLDDVNVLLNAGSGDFTEPPSSPEDAGSLPQAVAAADFDGDSDSDLAVPAGGGVEILVNNGSGDFQRSSGPATGNDPAAVAATDLDGDGDPDLAVANRGSDNVTILRKRLSAPNSFKLPGSGPAPVGDAPWAISAADFDGDGDNDLAVVNSGSDDVTILRNNGSARFREPGSSPESFGDARDFPVSVAAADFDADLDPDLAVGTLFAPASVAILRNKGITPP